MILSHYFTSTINILSYFYFYFISRLSHIYIYFSFLYISYYIYSFSMYAIRFYDRYYIFRLCCHYMFSCTSLIHRDYWSHLLFILYFLSDMLSFLSWLYCHNMLRIICHHAFFHFLRFYHYWRCRGITTHVTPCALLFPPFTYCWLLHFIMFYFSSHFIHIIFVDTDFSDILPSFRLLSS